MKCDLYLKHDIYTLDDPKIMKIVIKYDTVGYGLFWAIVEYLHKSETHYVNINEMISVLAFTFRSTSIETITTFVNDCVKIGLFKLSDSKELFSKRVIATYKEKEEYIRKQKEKANMRWHKDDIQEQCSGNAVALQEQYSGNTPVMPIKRKEQEKKRTIKESIKKADAFKAPTLEEIKAYCSEKGLVTDPVQFYNYFTEGDWKDANGNKVRNWKQKLLTWEKFNSASFRVKQPINTRQLTITDRNEREAGIISRNADGSINI